MGFIKILLILSLSVCGSFKNPAGDVLLAGSVFIPPISPYHVQEINRFLRLHEDKIWKKFMKILILKSLSIVSEFSISTKVKHHWTKIFADDVGVFTSKYDKLLRKHIEKQMFFKEPTFSWVWELQFPWNSGRYFSGVWIKHEWIFNKYCRHVFDNDIYSFCFFFTKLFHI